MGKIYDDITVKEMGKRFAQIRKRLGISQIQLAEELDSSQKRMSSIEVGENTISPIFLKTALFYLQHVSADRLFAREFDIDDPLLFMKDDPKGKFASVSIQLLKEDMKKEMDEIIVEWGRRIDDAVNYLK